MKNFFLTILAVGVAFAAAFFIASSRQASTDAARLAEQQAAWQAEKASLQTALEKAGEKHSPGTQVVTVEKNKKLDPREIIEKLRAGNSEPGDRRRMRIAIQQFENLIECGADALPAIRECLAQNEDVEYRFADKALGKISRVPGDFLAPPSLRFGLFDAARQIGGDAAEKILADILRTTGRGVEVAYLAQALQEMAPNRYRDLALSVAHDLLDHPAGGIPTDKYERDQLYGVLAMYGDGSLVAQVRNHVIQADGKIDKAVLNYLQKNLGEQTLPIAIEAYKDPRVDPSIKEPLARVALFYTGQNQQATEMFNTIINDNGLPVDLRREMAEDLNQDGFVNEKHPTPEDIKLVGSRLKLIDKYLGTVADPKIHAGFMEAQKDLLDMQKQSAETAVQ